MLGSFGKDSDQLLLLNISYKVHALTCLSRELGFSIPYPLGPHLICLMPPLGLTGDIQLYSWWLARLLITVVLDSAFSIPPKVHVLPYSMPPKTNGLVFHTLHAWGRMFFFFFLKKMSYAKPSRSLVRLQPLLYEIGKTTEWYREGVGKRHRETHCLCRQKINASLPERRNTSLYPSSHPPSQPAI